MRDIIHALPNAQGYSDSKGILPARRAVVARYQTVPNFLRFDVDDVYLGDGVSELITMTLQALLDDGDQVLVPAPNYPLWTAAMSLAGGTPVHYLCDEMTGWQPAIEDLEATPSFVPMPLLSRRSSPWEMCGAANLSGLVSYLPDKRHGR